MTEEEKIKIVLIGESGVGKTNLIQVAMGKPFQADSESTISSSYFEGDIIVNNKQYFYSLWDTAGQEAYRSLNKMFIKGSKIVIVVFAINSRSSFEQVDFWVNYAKETLGEHRYTMGLVANKSDLIDEQQVPDEEIMNKGKSLNIPVKITSAMEDAVSFKQFMDQLLKNFITTFGFQLGQKNKSFSIKSEKDDNEKEQVGDNNERRKKKCC